MATGKVKKGKLTVADTRHPREKRLIELHGEFAKAGMKAGFKPGIRDYYYDSEFNANRPFEMYLIHDSKNKAKIKKFLDAKFSDIPYQYIDSEKGVADGLFLIFNEEYFKKLTEQDFVDFITGKKKCPVMKQQQDGPTSHSSTAKPAASTSAPTDVKVKNRPGPKPGAKAAKRAAEALAAKTSKTSKPVAKKAKAKGVKEIKQTKAQITLANKRVRWGKLRDAKKSADAAIKVLQDLGVSLETISEKVAIKTTIKTITRISEKKFALLVVEEIMKSK